MDSHTLRTLLEERARQQDIFTATIAGLLISTMQLSDARAATPASSAEFVINDGTCVVQSLRRHHREICMLSRRRGQSQTDRLQIRKSFRPHYFNLRHTLRRPPNIAQRRDYKITLVSSTDDRK
ncbi:unnamed protein product [Nippostrongylus brasiliensis]|uniref:Transposase n=1 Tax=Nippostrongylus brasiliensis TaxID=27835 RepID=A0A0N4Y8S2_NIPBR|nr:unnamed protein product [Nippostrongylus brasiliensis]